jgi:acetate kinase
MNWVVVSDANENSTANAMNVLVVNSGSSTLKIQVIATDLERISQHQDDRICRGRVEGIGGEAIIHLQ